MDKPNMLEILRRYNISLGKNKKTLCPFHKEKNPSLSIKGNVYNCFSCGAKGDSIDFVMRIESCDFKKALEILKLENHKKIKHYSIENKREQIKKEKYHFRLNMFVSCDNICLDNEPLFMEEPNNAWIVANELREEYWEELLKCN